MGEAREGRRDKEREAMMIQVEIGGPRKEDMTISVVNTEPGGNKGVVKALKAQWGPWLRRNYRGLDIPICCEYCRSVGEAMWHCHKAGGHHQHLNVMPWSTCSMWEPNVGLMMYLHRRWFKQKFMQELPGVSTDVSETAEDGG